MRDEQARSNKQTKQSNTMYPGILTPHTFNGVKGRTAIQAQREGIYMYAWLQLRASHITLLFAVDESSFLGAVVLIFFYYCLFHRYSMLFDL